MPLSNMVEGITYTTTTASCGWNPVIETKMPPSKDEIIKDVVDIITHNWDDITEKICDAEARKEHNRLMGRQAFNKHYRSFVKHVHWSGNTCVVYWHDGTYTKAHWNPNEFFDPEKAILVCMARRLYGDTNIYNEVLQKYAPDGWDHYEKAGLFVQENDGEWVGGTD